MKIKATIKRLFTRFLGLFPSAVPVGLTEFHAWSDSIIATAGLDTVPAEDQKFVIASLLLHLGPAEAYKPREYFVRSLRKAAASQIASQVFSDIKRAQEERMKAAIAPQDKV